MGIFVTQGLTQGIKCAILSVHNKGENYENRILGICNLQPR